MFDIGAPVQVWIPEPEPEPELVKKDLGELKHEALSNSEASISASVRAAAVVMGIDENIMLLEY